MSVGAALYRWQHLARQRFVGGLYAWRRTSSIAQLSGPPRRALFVLTGLLGDTVMSLPVLQEARRLWPEAHLTVLGLAHNQALLSGCPFIDAFHVPHDKPFSLRQGGCPRSLRQWLREQQFDLATILLGDHFAAVIAAAGVPIRVGCRGHALEPCLTHTYDIGSPRLWGPPERLNALRVLGCEVQEVLPRLHVPAPAHEPAAAALQKLGLSNDVRYVAVHPFGSTARQWWPAARLGPLAESLAATSGMKTVVIGGPEVCGCVPVRASSHLVDATGAFCIPQLLAVLQGAALVISTDSGPFHMAGALGRPVVGLFRASRPEHAQRYPSAQSLLGQDPACERACTWDRCQASPCRQLLALSVDEVAVAARKVCAAN